MKTHLTDYSKYNIWANEKVTDFLITLPDEQLDKEIISSFHSLKKTMFHIWDAQIIWITRLHGNALTTFPSRNFAGTFKEAMEGVIKSSEELAAFVESSSENFLRTSITYKNLAGEEYKNKVSDIIQHVVNHGTYHRGQIITMLRQLGFTKLFSTDYIAFCRETVEINN